ncbi:MAG: hypothetical protein J0M24_07895 [Verrucomicrobia bacterium]|nr:hypothetical protein [Verrucomicrobiota bacterium]
MRLTANRMRLTALTKSLLVKWAETRETWKDDRAQQFEQLYLRELEASVDASLGVVEELDELINQLRTDCE